MIELSVIIATYNRAESLRACLEALFHQTQPAADYEIVVVVDGSTDGTQEMLAGLGAECALVVCSQENQGAGAARNHGVRVASGRYCLFIDDDIVAEPGLIARHLQAQREHGGAVVLGKLETIVPADADPFAWHMGRWLDRHYERLEQGTEPLSFTDSYSGNFSVPRSAFEQVGGFSVDLGRSEDVELGYRLTERGLALVYVPEAVGRQEYGKRFRQIVADAEREGGASLELVRRHPAMLPQLGLGRFHETSLRAVWLRRVLLRLNCPMWLLRLVTRVISGRPWADEWYRFVYQYFYWLGVRRCVPDRETWQRLTAGTLILMYHAIGRREEPASRYVIREDRFARQMAWLQQRKYRVLSLEEYLSLRREYRLPPARSVVITFDDGYADNCALGSPVLRRRGYPATVFVVTGAMGTARPPENDGLLERPMLSWGDIRKMQEEGISFGAHARTHASLVSLPLAEVETQVCKSRADLEQELGRPVPAFAYPYGKRNQAVANIVERAGFLGACGIQPGANGPATDPLALRRVEVHGTDSLARFALTLGLGFRP